MSPNAGRDRHTTQTMMARVLVPETLLRQRRTTTQNERNSRLDSDLHGDAQGAHAPMPNAASAWNSATKRIDFSPQRT